MKELGLSMQQVKAMNPEEQFTAVVGALGKMEDANKRASVGFALLGRSFANIVPLSKEMEELQKRAEKLGLVMSKEDIYASEAFGDAMDEVKQATEGFWHQIGAVITTSPMVRAFFEGTCRIG
jgi:hypothetical protein